MNGLTITDFQSSYYKEFHKRLGYEDARRILKTLCSVGLLTETTDQNDKRLRRYTLLQVVVNGQDEELENKTLPPSEKEYSLEDKPSIPEVYESMRSSLKGSFKEEKALELIAKLRDCDRSEAEKLFKALVDDGKVFRDSEGLWSFG